MKRCKGYRCGQCGCFMYRISEDNYTCCNERCDGSWQAAKREFDSSLLGAAVRQLVGAASRDEQQQ